MASYYSFWENRFHVCSFRLAVSFRVSERCIDIYDVVMKRRVVSNITFKITLKMHTNHRIFSKFSAFLAAKHNIVNNSKSIFSPYPPNLTNLNALKQCRLFGCFHRMNFSEKKCINQQNNTYLCLRLGLIAFTWPTMYLQLPQFALLQFLQVSFSKYFHYTQINRKC